MEVTFETTAGQVFTVEVWYMSSVTRMKMAVELKECISVESQRFFFEGRELLDDMDAAQCSIVHGSRVRLVQPGDHGYHFRGGWARNVRLRVVVTGAAPQLGSEGVMLRVSSSCTFGRLKELVEERTDGALPAARLALLFGNVEMRDHKVVAEYARVRPDMVPVTAVLRPPHENDDVPSPARNVRHAEVGETSNSKLSNCGWFWRCAYDDDM